MVMEQDKKDFSTALFLSQPQNEARPYEQEPQAASFSYGCCERLFCGWNIRMSIFSITDPDHGLRY